MRQNIYSAPVVILLNNPAGISVNDVQPSNVLTNILSAPVVMPLNKSPGIFVNDVQSENVW